MVTACTHACEPGGINGFHCTDRIALDARNLNQATDRVAGEAKVCLLYTSDAADE